MSPEEIILKELENFNSRYNEPAFARQIIAFDPKTNSCYTSQQTAYYLTKLVKKGKIERIPTEKDAYRYIIK